MPKSRDFWAGFTFAAFGLFALLLSPAERGTAGEMGPGYFPVVLGSLLCLIGILLGIRGLSAEARQDVVTTSPMRPFLVILSILVFGLLLERTGLIIAAVAMIFIAGFASRGFSLKQLTALTLALLALVWVIFVWAIGMPIRLGPAASLF